MKKSKQGPREVWPDTYCVDVASSSAVGTSGHVGQFRPSEWRALTSSGALRDLLDDHHVSEFWKRLFGAGVSSRVRRVADETYVRLVATATNMHAVRAVLARTSHVDCLHNVGLLSLQRHWGVTIRPRPRCCSCG